MSSVSEVIRKKIISNSRGGIRYYFPEVGHIFHLEEEHFLLEEEALLPEEVYFMEEEEDRLLLEEEEDKILFLPTKRTIVFRTMMIFLWAKIIHLCQKRRKKRKKCFLWKKMCLFFESSSGSRSPSYPEEDLSLSLSLSLSARKISCFGSR